MSGPDRRPAVGTIIDGKDNHAYRVMEHREPLDGSYLYELIVERLTGQHKGQHYGIRVKSQYAYWRYLDEHYTVCNCCNELPPCSGKRAEHAVEKSVEEMKLPDGYCPACKEPITHRQKKHVFPGPNLLNPFGADGVQFHQRGMCHGAAVEYEEKWVRADPSRARSLLTLRCSGTVTVHGDGTAECHSRNDGEDCPNIYARHMGMRACYTLSNGCGRGCERQGHPGTRLSPGLNPAGDLDGSTLI